MFKAFIPAPTPRESLKEAQQRAGVIKANVTFLREEASQRGLEVNVILGKGLSDLREHRNRIAVLSEAIGLSDLSAEVGFDVVSGMAQVVEACDEVLSCIATSMPVDAEGWLLVQRFENGKIVHRNLRPEELSGLITALKKIEALID